MYQQLLYVFPIRVLINSQGYCSNQLNSLLISREENLYRMEMLMHKWIHSFWLIKLGMSTNAREEKTLVQSPSLVLSLNTFDIISFLQILSSSKISSCQLIFLSLTQSSAKSQTGQVPLAIAPSSFQTSLHLDNLFRIHKMCWLLSSTELGHKPLFVFLVTYMI